jgi:hypothetical protein
MPWKDYELISDLGREECVRRLQLQTDPPGTFFSKKPLIGYVDATGLEIRKHIKHQDGFQPWLIGEIVDESGRTRLRFHFGMSFCATAFVTIWFGGMLFMGGAMLMAAIRSLPSGAYQIPDALVAIAISLLQLLVGLGMRLGRRSEEQFLIEFLRDTIEAREG